MPDGAEMRLRAVGVVRSPVKERKRMPVWGAPASVEIHPAYADALLRIEKHSHLWVFGWLSMGRDERHVLQVTPRGVTDPGPEGLHGVFSVRSPARPNPIGLTAARVVGREGLVLHMDRLDFLDGTPVLDLKPYFITRDLIFSANGLQVGKPRSREDLRESLVVQAVHFHGALAPEIALAVRIVEHFRLTYYDLNDPGEYRIIVPLARPVLADGLMGITRATPGRGTLHFAALDTMRFDSIAAYRPEAVLPASAEEILGAEDAALFICERA
ncbi:MAG: tRNA (N6-threonylcarbamoyladenosine(37)-N6)-methyltransferase TrmO [Candidatus Solibacter usitatus]|nr:tRNA (N6-threonylcarbamoyladenosine(37)-N6)-methyltransferase TrmO [Candidatus Solibacter usitatus]